jgi:hypothetical protein
MELETHMISFNREFGPRDFDEGEQTFSLSRLEFISVDNSSEANPEAEKGFDTFDTHGSLFSELLLDFSWLTKPNGMSHGHGHNLREDTFYCPAEPRLT